MEKAFTNEIQRFGLEIKRLRKSINLSQRELAFEIGVDERTIQRIEKGQHGIGMHILFALAKTLNTKPSEILASIERESE